MNIKVASFATVVLSALMFVGTSVAADKNAQAAIAGAAFGLGARGVAYALHESDIADKQGALLGGGVLGVLGLAAYQAGKRGDFQWSTFGIGVFVAAVMYAVSTFVIPVKGTERAEVLAAAKKCSHS